MCSIISAGFSLVAIIFAILINGIHQLPFTFGWIIFFTIVLVMSVILLISASRLKSLNLTRENLGVSYLKDSKITLRIAKSESRMLVNTNNLSQISEKSSQLQVKNFCRYCGNPLEENYNYCPFCGNYI